MSPVPSGLVRVEPSSPCPICGKGDWCLRADDGSYAVCSRIESSKRAGDAGWRHQLSSSARPPRARALSVSAAGRDFGPLAQDAAARRVNATTRDVPSLSLELGVSEASLQRLSVGWIGWAWTFPMSDESGQCVGIRLRRRDGEKLAVSGSRQGIFIPSGVRFDRTLLVVEGASDTASALDLGFDAIGRPSCSGGTEILIRLVRSQSVRDLVIVSDGDGPGRDGARRLALSLCPYTQVRLIEPPAPHKDLRDWRRAGALHCDLQSLIASAQPYRLTVEVTP